MKTNVGNQCSANVNMPLVDKNGIEIFPGDTLIAFCDLLKEPVRFSVIKWKENDIRVLIEGDCTNTSRSLRRFLYEFGMINVVQVLNKSHN